MNIMYIITGILYLNIAWCLFAIWYKHRFGIQLPTYDKQRDLINTAAAIGVGIFYFVGDYRSLFSSSYWGIILLIGAIASLAIDRDL